MMVARLATSTSNTRAFTDIFDFSHWIHLPKPSRTTHLSDSRHDVGALILPGGGAQIFENNKRLVTAIVVYSVEAISMLDQQ